MNADQLGWFVFAPLSTLFMIWSLLRLRRQRLATRAALDDLISSLVRLDEIITPKDTDIG